MLDTIPAPLLDRMEVLEVSGYVSEEKSQIASKYLGPQAKEAAGLKEADIELDPAAVDVLIKYYCRESGVRNLKKHIDKVRLCYMPTCLQFLIRWSAPDLPQGCSEDRTGPWRRRIPRALTGPWCGSDRRYHGLCEVRFRVQRVNDDGREARRPSQRPGRA